MIKLLLKVFVKISDGESGISIRTKYSVFAGITGIILNLFLFIVKLTVGTLMSSVAVISDAFNNLSDSGSSIVSIIGAKLSSKKPDKEHPLGHGRIEYVSSLIVSFIIILVGFELLKTGFTKIAKPENIVLNPALIALLVASILIKLWMYSYNRYIGRKINSKVLLATSLDSISDVFATLGVIAGALFGGIFEIPWVDGVIGVFVSIAIMYSGIKIAMDTIGVLLGTVPDGALIDELQKTIVDAPGIFGVHDLIIHDYGPGRVMASIHAEVPDDSDIVSIHETIDNLEHTIEKEYGVHIVIHMDPVSVNCEDTARVRDLVLKTVKNIDSRLNIHDFRMTDGHSKVNLIFDLEVPAGVQDISSLKAEIQSQLKKEDSRFNTIIKIDLNFDE